MEPFFKNLLVWPCASLKQQSDLLLHFKPPLVSTETLGLCSIKMRGHAALYITCDPQMDAYFLSVSNLRCAAWEQNSHRPNLSCLLPGGVQGPKILACLFIFVLKLEPRASTLDFPDLFYLFKFWDRVLLMAKLLRLGWNLESSCLSLPEFWEYRCAHYAWVEAQCLYSVDHIQWQSINDTVNAGTPTLQPPCQGVAVTLLLTSQVTLGRLFSFSEPRFPHL